MSRIKNKYVLGLDVSTTTIGISFFELNKNNNLKLIELTHFKLKDKKGVDKNNLNERLLHKIDTFEEYMEKYANIKFDYIVIEEPLLRSNNVNTVGTLLRFNAMVTKLMHDMYKIVPAMISSYDARKFAFPDLMTPRKYNRKGELLDESKLGKPVLFGGYPTDIDKKHVIWEKVSDKESTISWIYNKKGVLTKENYDAADAYTCVLGYINKAITNGII